MFTIAELKTYVESVVPYTYYHNEFPTTAPDNAAYVRIHGGFRPDQWTNVRRPSFQVVIRGKTGPATEAVAAALYEAFHQRRFYEIGTQHITASFADQSAPLYIGLDDNNRAMYSVNFTLVLLAN